MLEPANELTRFLRHFQRRHDNAASQRSLPLRSLIS
jgi:hypothetical protein